MGLAVFANNATSLLQAAITNAQTTLTVAAADAALFPAPAAGDWFPVTLVEGTKLEICQCTGRAGAVLTVVRGQEGTAAQAFGINAQVDHRLTKNALQTFLQDAPSDGSTYGRKNGAWAGTISDAVSDGQFYGRVNAAWTVGYSKAATDTLLAGKIGDAPNDANAYVRSGLAWVLGYSKTALDTSLAGKVAKAGDTMTGDLTISNATTHSTLILNKPTGAFYNLIRGYRGGVVAANQRWHISPGNNIGETGGNVGSDFEIGRYNDTGGYVDSPFNINRATGNATFSGSVATGPLSITGNMAATGNLSGGQVTCTQNVVSSSALLLLACTGAGNIYLRPNGAGSATNQATLDNNGALGIAGNITSALGFFANDGTINHRVSLFSGGAVYTGTFSAHSVNQQIGNAVIGTWESGGLRVGQSGTDFGVGVTSYTSSVAGAGSILANTGLIVSKRAGTSNVSNMSFMNNAAATPTTVGSISTSGSATAFNTSSDENLKDFIGEYDPLAAIDIIRRDPVRDFTWKVDGSYAVGWGAQTSYVVSRDLAAPPPEPEEGELRGGPGEAGYVPWGMDQSKRTPYLWAALSWALDEIDALTARVTALETP